MSAPSPRPSGERIKGEGGRLHVYNALLQATVSGLQGEDRQEFAAEQEPLTLDPLPARAGRGSRYRDPLIKRNQFSRQFCLMRPMLALRRGGRGEACAKAGRTMAHELLRNLKHGANGLERVDAAAIAHLSVSVLAPAP